MVVQTIMLGLEASEVEARGPTNVTSFGGRLSDRLPIFSCNVQEVADISNLVLTAS